MSTKRDELAPLEDLSTIETPEQLELHLPIAGVGTRGAAYLIDLLWQIIPIVGMMIVLTFFLPDAAHPKHLLSDESESGSSGAVWALAFMNAVIFFVNFGYFALFELFWKGQTPGKRALGLRVVRDGGYPVDGASALVRNLLRAVDFLPTFYALGIISIFAGGKGKRIGDYAGGTFVVAERKPEPHRRERVSAEHVPEGLTQAEHALVLEFLSRRPGLDAAVRKRLAHDLASRISVKLGGAMPVDPEAYLEEVRSLGRR